MLSILGEGRGHMTQAIAVKEMVERAGHRIVSVVLGMGQHRQAPPFFASAMKMPIEQIPTLDFSYKNNRNVNLLNTLVGTVRKIPAYWSGVQKIRDVVRNSEPDIIVNFFEPVTGIYALTHRRRPPVLAVAHQFMCDHPDYVRAPGLRLQQFGMKWYVKLVAAGSAKLALSFYEAPDLPDRDVTVSPPILRRQLFELEPTRDGNFVLAYLLNHGYADEIIAWHNKNPETVLHCFYDKPGAPAKSRYDATLTFHRLDGEKFLRMMAECKYVACTAGFESLSEAAYLGKPMFLMPVKNHVEQQINAIDAARIGFGITDSSFNLDRLSELPDRLANSTYRTWLSRAGSVFLRTLERVVRDAHHERDTNWELQPQESNVG
jgi:uncharacterized protein (TIGR00661 family)